MSAPAQVTGSPVATTYNVAGGPKTSTAITVHVGDILVVVWGAENELGTPTITNSGTAQTWTAVTRDTAATGWGQVAGWTATSTVAASMTVTVANAGAGLNGFSFFVYDGTTSGGVGNTAHGKSSTSPGSGSTVPALSLACSANSAAVAINTDWSALDHGATTRSYNTATAGTATEQQYFSNGSNYSEETWAHADVGAAGTKTIGLTSPVNQTWSTIAIEVLGTAGSSTSAAPRGFNAIPFMGGVL